MHEETSRIPNVGLDEAHERLAMSERTSQAQARLERLWTYYRNPITSSVPIGPGGSAGSGGRVRLGQEVGLPLRLRPGRRDPRLDRTASAPEIVIENDIAWRIHTMVEFLFGRGIKIVSRAKDRGLRERIEQAIDAAWARSGGTGLLQDFALLGHVYGYADLIVRDEPEGPRVELIDPVRSLPMASFQDYRQIQAYAIQLASEQRSSGRTVAEDAIGRWVEWITPQGGTMYEGERVHAEYTHEAFGGEIPIAHAQNLAQPFHYEGLSEVEPLIPLQDELNTRLSDRASRVTLQSFKMYLVKGLEMNEAVIGPGQVFTTDNLGASIQGFGGDMACPSEDAHIADIRDALDKASGVPPVATGVVQAKVGNLTSANALRLTLVGLLAKTARKRVTYGQAVLTASRLILSALSFHGVLVTRPEDRVVDIEWEDPLPKGLSEQLEHARFKQELGVSASEVLEDLGEIGAAAKASDLAEEVSEVQTNSRGEDRRELKKEQEDERSERSGVELEAGDVGAEGDEPGDETGAGRARAGGEPGAGGPGGASAAD